MSSVQFTRFFMHWWPEFVSDGTLTSLLQIKDLAFCGPSVLFAYLGANRLLPQFPLPIHIQCPHNSFQEVRDSLAKHARQQQEHQTDYHFLHKHHYETYAMTNTNATVFLFDESDIVSFVDVYNISFNASNAFQTTTQQQSASLEMKMCHLNAQIVKRLLINFETLERFLDFDCWMLHSLDFQIDWNSQRMWRHIWKLIIQAPLQQQQRQQSQTWLDIVDAWNAKVVPHYVHTQSTLNRRPFLAVSTRVPFLQKDQMSIGNALYGSALLSQNVMLRDTSILESLPFLKLDVVNLALAVTIQIGEFFDDNTQQQKFLLRHGQPIDLGNLFQTNLLAMHVPPEQQKTCRVFGETQQMDMTKFLQTNEHSVAVFRIKKNNTSRNMQAYCYDWKQLSPQRRMYVCDMSNEKSNKRKTYWELDILDEQKQHVIISEENWNIIHRRTTRYFVLIQLRTNVTFIDADDVDNDVSDRTCEQPRTVSGLMPIVLSSNTLNTPQRAVRKIFKTLSAQLPPSMPQKQQTLQNITAQYDDDATETETTFSGLEEEEEEDSEQEYRNMRRQQHQHDE